MWLDITRHGAISKIHQRNKICISPRGVELISSPNSIKPAACQATIITQHKQKDTGQTETETRGMQNSKI